MSCMKRLNPSSVSCTSRLACCLVCLGGGGLESLSDVICLRLGVEVVVCFEVCLGEGVVLGVCLVDVVGVLYFFELEAEEEEEGGARTGRMGLSLHSVCVPWLVFPRLAFQRSSAFSSLSNSVKVSTERVLMVMDVATERELEGGLGGFGGFAFLYLVGMMVCSGNSSCVKLPKGLGVEGMGLMGVCWVVALVRGGLYCSKRRAGFEKYGEEGGMMYL